VGNLRRRVQRLRARFYCPVHGDEPLLCSECDLMELTDDEWDELACLNDRGEPPGMARMTDAERERLLALGAKLVPPWLAGSGGRTRCPPLTARDPGDGRAPPVRHDHSCPLPLDHHRPLGGDRHRSLSDRVIDGARDPLCLFRLFLLVLPPQRTDPWKRLHNLFQGRRLRSERLVIRHN
jgi:hypothetical protein